MSRIVLFLLCALLSLLVAACACPLPAVTYVAPQQFTVPDLPAEIASPSTPNFRQRLRTILIDSPQTPTLPRTATMPASPPTTPSATN